jgi:hypothetical protein
MAWEAYMSARRELAVSSPSGAFKEIGEETGAGMAIGIENTIGEVVDATVNVMEAGKDAAQDAAVQAITAHQAEIAAIENKMSYMREELDLRRAIAEEARATRNPETPGIGTTVSTGMHTMNAPPASTTPAPTENVATKKTKSEPEHIIIEFRGSAPPGGITPEQVAAIVVRTMKSHDRAGR